MKSRVTENFPFLSVKIEISLGYLPCDSSLSEFDDITEEISNARYQRNSQRLKRRFQGISSAIRNALTSLKGSGDIARAITSLAGLANLLRF